MEILVLIKQVPDDSVEVTVNPSTGAPDLAEITPVVNAFDTYALEMAARFKEANGGTVTVASIGGDEVDTGLRNCLSVGADKAYLIKDDSFKDADSTAKAYILSQAIPKIEEANGAKFDMIFTGLAVCRQSNFILNCYDVKRLCASVVWTDEVYPVSIL